VKNTNNQTYKYIQAAKLYTKLKLKMPRGNIKHWSNRYQRLMSRQTRVLMAASPQWRLRDPSLCLFDSVTDGQYAAQYSSIFAINDVQRRYTLRRNVLVKARTVAYRAM